MRLKLKEFSKSFLFRAWLSVVLAYTLIVLSAQMAYVYVTEKYNNEWREIYHTEVLPALSDIITAGSDPDKINPLSTIENLADKYSQYLTVYSLGAISADQNILKAHTELFEMSNIKQNQLIYFTGKDTNLYLIEIKNPSHSVLYFSLSTEGFIIRTIPIFIFILFFTFFWARKFLSPVEALIKAAQQVGKGDLQEVSAVVNQNATPEIQELTQTFNVMVKNLAKLQKSQQEMISDIAHELRSPLARQKLAINLLKDRQFHKFDYKELLDRVENEGTRLNELIDEILNYLRPLQSNHLQFDELSEHIYLTSMLESITDDAAFEFSKQNKGIETHIDLEQEFIVLGDYLKLERAIENIVRNALFHTKPYTKIQVSLTTDKETNEAVIAVRDFGSGVPEENIPFLTKPFYRIDSARNKKDGGYGLGLTITNAIINNHNGSLSFKNAEDEGFIVIIKVPLISNDI